MGQQAHGKFGNDRLTAGELCALIFARCAMSSHKTNHSFRRVTAHIEGNRAIPGIGFARIKIVEELEPRADVFGAGCRDR